MVTCLASPDPELRDEFAYTTLAKLLRDETPATGRLEFLSARLDGLLQQPDPVGVAHPFAILVFAEIARTDRIESWMSPAQRQDLVDKAGNYLESVADYRGFDRAVGWRHGVAHGADLAMQLALNPALSRAQQLQTPASDWPAGCAGSCLPVWRACAPRSPGSLPRHAG